MSKIKFIAFMWTCSLALQEINCLQKASGQVCYKTIRRLKTGILNFVLERMQFWLCWLVNLLAYDAVYFDVHLQVLWRELQPPLARRCMAVSSETLVSVCHTTRYHMEEARKPDTTGINCNLKFGAYNWRVYINGIVCRIVSDHPQRD